MKIFLKLLLISVLTSLIISCNKNNEQLIKIDEVSPWCIIGFDSLERTPEQRIKMLEELGLKKYGFNRGKGEFDEMIQEFNLAKEHGIEITSTLLWLNAKRDSLGQLSPSNQELLDNIKHIEQKPVIWISFSNNYFEKIDDEESIKLAVEMIKFIKLTTDEIGCKIALYNHHGWFGNPMNQLEILKELKDDSITMVYNFHHAHEYLDDYKSILKKIKPHLSYVNLNGIQKEGPQILTIGQGDYEYEMIKTLKEEGYNGPWGILGHIKTEDVEKVLVRNIEGLKSLNALYNEKRNITKS